MLPFQLKKFISQFLMPMPLVCECFLLGWILTRFTKYKKTGKVFYLLAFTLFLVFGYGFGRTYLYNLERRYPAFDPTPEQCEALRGAPVVVLGQGMPIKSDLPLRYQNNPVFERRLFEGVRVAKLIPESRLIVSMAGEASNSVKQAFLDGYMLQVNFPTNRVFMFTTARDTAEEAKLAKQAIEKCANARMRECANGDSFQVSSFKFQVSSLSTNALMNSRTNELLPALSHYRTNELNNTLPRIVLATSASHIPRAMKIFQKQGLNPIASPCDYTDCEAPKLTWGNWYQWPLPNGKNIDYSKNALHEWVGNLYERIF
jgi:uncharacterized SAM-binding protein YcdF (DUF218 family)